MRYNFNTLIFSKFFQAQRTDAGCYTLMFPGLNNLRRKFVHDLSDRFSFNHNSRGGSRHRCLYVSTSTPVTLGLSADPSKPTDLTSTTIDTASTYITSASSATSSTAKPIDPALEAELSALSLLATTRAPTSSTDGSSTSIAAKEAGDEGGGDELDADSAARLLDAGFEGSGPDSRPFTYLPFIKDILVFPGDQVLVLYPY